MIKPNFEQYKKEQGEWLEQGAPLRSKEKIEEIYSICDQCDKGIKVNQLVNIIQCSECTCFIRPKGTKANKAAWATTRCPLDKWVEEPGYEKAQIEKEAEPEVPAQPQQFNTRKPKNPGGSCGCG